MKKRFVFFLITCFGLLTNQYLAAQTGMGNLFGRKLISLNGKWQVIIDPNDVGNRMGIGKDTVPAGKKDFLEYSFDDAPVLDVPGDFNSQLPELTYYESSVWYKRSFKYMGSGKRLFLYFGAVNYLADVYLNGEKLGSHEGGFTPFQFEITSKVKAQNRLVVRVNNQRRKDGIPAVGFDWFNYGGITREVDLIETPASFIEDYFIQLKKGSDNVIKGWIKINGGNRSQKIHIGIAGTKINYTTIANEADMRGVMFNARLEWWSPAHPKLYTVSITCETDKIAGTDWLP